MHAPSLIAFLTVSAAALVSATPTSTTSCGRSEFYWSTKSCCLPNGGPSNNPPSPPKNTSCPNNWYWTNDKNCCAPRSQPPANSQTTCSTKGHSWDKNSVCCKPPSTTPSNPAPPSTPSGQCKSSEFWWDSRKCCLPHGGNPNPPSPPTNTRCPPNNWEWSHEKTCCIPKTPPPSNEPSCDNGWKWNHGNSCCDKNPPPPQPSGSYHNKRAKKEQLRVTDFCPIGFQSCPVKGVLGESECIDTTSEITSCGGCTSVGEGQNCDNIPNSLSTTCLASKCGVLQCEPDYTVSDDGTSCVHV